MTGLLSFLILTLAVLLGAGGNVGAQAWVQDPGGVYFKVATSVLVTDGEFNHEGDRQDIFVEDLSRMDTSFRDLSIGAYVEYGLSERFTQVTSIPFKIMTSKETRMIGGGFDPQRITLTNGGLGDLRVALRTQLFREPFAAAIQTGLKIPTGYETDPDNGGPTLGSGKIDAEAHVLVGKSLYPLPAYVSGGVGYRIRGGGLHDEFLSNAEAGYTAGRVFVKLRFDGLINEVPPPDLAAAALQLPINGGGGARNEILVGDQDIFQLSPGITYQVKDNVAISAEAFHTFAGKNTTMGTTFSLGVVYTR